MAKKSYVEKTWKVVDLKQYNKTSYTPLRSSKNDEFKNWYDTVTTLSEEWKKNVAKFRQMDLTIDINRALDIIAEDVASDGGDDEKMFVLETNDDDAPKSKIKTITEMQKLWEKRSGLDINFFQYVRELCEYGLVLIEIGKDGELKKLEADRIEGAVWGDDDNITHYLYNPNNPFVVNNDETVDTKKKNTGATVDLIQYKVEDLLILKLGEGAFGESVLKRVYRTWKQLQLLEDAVVIYRIVRAPERRVFMVDIGNMPAHKAESYIENIRRRQSQKQVTNASSGEYETEYNPASMQEDYYVGTTSEGRGSRIETLPGGENLGRIEDLQWFNKKLALGMRIPPSYLDSYSEDSNGGTYNDGRVGTAYIAELRYAGYIRRVQKRVALEISKHFRLFCKSQKVEIPEMMEIQITPPQSFVVYKENEVNNALWNTYSSAENSEFLSKRFAIKKYLHWEDDELVENENAKMEEIGIEMKIIKSMPNEIRNNLIYGTGDYARTWIETNHPEITPTPEGGEAEDTPPEEE